MKDSGVPWLGEVPEHWRVLPNRTVFTEVNERGRAEADMLSVTIMRGVIRQQVLLEDSSKKDGSNRDKSAYKLVRPGDIAYNKMRAWQGALGVSEYEGIVSPAYVVQRPREGAAPRYVHYLLRTPGFAKEAERWSYGITSDMWSLRPEHFKMIYSCLPPESEQTAIVRFLDHADRRIRRYIRAKQKLIKLLEEQKQAIIHRAVTRGLDPNVRLKPSGVEWLGDVPEHWEIRRAKAVCSAIVDCKNRTPEAVDGGRFLVVRTTCVRGGTFNPSGGYATDEKNFRIWTTRGAPQRGDVFFTREAPAGEACLVPDRTDLCMGQRMMYFRPNPELLDPEFLLLSVYGPLTRTYVELATNGSTVGHLRLHQVYSLPLIWCPLEEQRAIVGHSREMTRGIERARADAEQEIVLLREYRTRLIADVVTGKLDVREAALLLPDEVEEAEAIDEVGDEGDADEMSSGGDSEAGEEAEA
jgi:type I restriction enzyme S subunit